MIRLRFFVNCRLNGNLSYILISSTGEFNAIVVSFWGALSEIDEEVFEDGPSQSSNDLTNFNMASNTSTLSSRQT